VTLTRLVTAAKQDMTMNAHKATRVRRFIALYLCT
jgi:hypothetical protein